MAKTASGKPPLSPIYMILLGLLVAGIGIFEYIDIGKWEHEGGTRMMNSILAAVYHVAGRLGVLGICLGAAILFLFLGITRLVKREES